MNKVFTIIAAFFILAVSGSAATIEKNYDYKNFREVEVSNFFDVTLNRSDVYKIGITVSEEYEQYLDIKVKNGTLYIAFKSLPAKLSAVQIGKIAKAEISMPEIERLCMTGASKLTSSDSFDLGQGVFNLSMSGASQINNLDINATESRMYLSGAAKCSLTGKFAELHFNVSGVSRAEVNASADDLHVMSSGTAVMEIEGEFDEVELQTSGVANITMKGNAEEMEITGSGTSGIDVTDFEVNEAKVSLGGAAVAKVNVRKELEVNLEAASRCSYVGCNTLNIKKNLSREAKLKEL